MRTFHGYSLFELVITLVLAAILAALSLPYLAGTEANATWFHEQVKASLRYAQRQAVANKHPVYVFLKPQEVVLCFANADPCPSNELSPYAVKAPSGVSLDTTTSFSFDGLGRPSFASTQTFSVGGRSVRVYAETGYVTE